MLEAFRALPLSKKLAFGFGASTAGLGLVLLVSATVFNGSNQGLGRYRAIARNSNAVGRLQANTLLTRMAVKDYLIKDSKEAVEAGRSRGAKGIQFAKDAAEGTADEARRAELEKAHQHLENYAKTFEEVVAHGNKAQDTVTELSALGGELAGDLSNDLEGWAEQRNYDALIKTAGALDYILRMRVGVYQYLSGHADNLLVSYDAHMRGAKIIAGLPEPHRSDLDELMVEYRELLDVLKAEEGAKRAKVTGTLDVIGPQVATIAEDIKLAYIDEQDALGPALVAKNRRWLGVLIAFGLVVAVLSLLAGRATAVSVTGPVRDIGEVVDAMAAGDFSQRVDVNSNDEIGHLAESVNRMASDVSDVLDAIQNGANTLGDSSQRLSAVSGQLLDRSARTASQSSSAANAVADANTNLGSIASASAQMSANVSGVSSAAEEMSSTMASVAASAEQMSETMNMVASSVEEMTASIAEVANNASSSSQLAAEAKSTTEVAARAMEALREQGNEIGKVTDAIKSIADQTNLLALNASIEAAGAGASGRGFAVVASEVKALAVQSGQAADDIAGRIDQVQSSTQAAAEAMARVAEFVERVNQSVEAIAAAVDQQTGAANDISRSVAMSSEGAQEIANSVAQANESASEVAQSIGEINLASGQVSSNSAAAAAGVDEVSRTLSQVREIAAQNDEGSREVSTAANDLAEVASGLRAKVDGFRFSRA